MKVPATTRMRIFHRNRRLHRTRRVAAIRFHWPIGVVPPKIATSTTTKCPQTRMSDENVSTQWFTKVDMQKSATTPNTVPMQCIRTGPDILIAPRKPNQRISDALMLRSSETWNRRDNGTPNSVQWIRRIDAVAATRSVARKKNARKRIE